MATKINEMKIDIAKINNSLENINYNSDAINEELKNFSSENDISSIENKLEVMKVDIDTSKQELDKIVEEKGYVDILREILNDTGAKAKIIKKYVRVVRKKKKTMIRTS